MALAHFRMLIHELLNKDQDIVPKESPLIILYTNSAFSMAKIVKDTIHKKHISRRVNFAINGENCKMHKIDWYEVFLELADIPTEEERHFVR